MPAGWAAAAAAVVGGVMQADAAKSAAKTQADAANRATDAQLSMFNTQNDQQKPYRDAGETALSQLLTGTGHQQAPEITQQNFDAKAYLAANPDVAADAKYGQNPYQHYLDFGKNEIAAGGNNRTLGFTPTPIDNGISLGQFNHQFNADDLNANLAPNYEFMKQQGLGATANAANASGGALSGNALKGITDYAVNYAGTGYQQAYNNYTANQANIFSRLASIAGLGQAANTQSANLAGTVSGGVSSSIQNAGTARGAGTVGAANSLSSGANNANGWFQLSNLTGGNSGSSSMTGSDGLMDQMSFNG